MNYNKLALPVSLVFFFENRILRTILRPSAAAALHVEFPLKTMEWEFYLEWQQDQTLCK